MSIEVSKQISTPAKRRLLEFAFNDVNDNQALTWTAVKAATMAGDPKPWVMREKWVKGLWMLESKICCGLVLHRGDLSWFSKSINSLVTILQKKTWRSMSDELWTYSNRVGSFWKDPIVIKKGQQQKTIDTHYDIRKGSICYVLNQLTESSLQSWFSYSFPCRNTSLSCDSLCSRNFQNVKLKLDFVEIWSFYRHSDFA